MDLCPYKFSAIYFTALLIVNCFIQRPTAGNSHAVTGEADYFNIILGRPSDKSITINLLPHKNISVYVEYKKSTESNYTKTEVKNCFEGISIEMELDNLQSNSLYNYQVLYRENSSGNFITGEEHSFHTQRSIGSSFTFTIEADPHPYDKKGSHNLWDVTLTNQLKDNPDFLFDLGDTFGDDHNPFTITDSEIKQLHLNNRFHLGKICHSVPLFFCLGNHEGESGYYLLQSPPNNLAIYGSIWRKYYYPNPFPNEFYSGNTETEPFGIEQPQNYYAWEWGDALFIVLDAYRYYTVNAKPRGWEWTLGEVQYNWFNETLENSKAKFKFVFIHHVLGETRGGVVVANGYEWGGYEKDNTTWGFDKNRPGWDLPIHQLMVKYNVDIFFQGHDHLYSKEELNGVIYQTVPMPSDSTYIIGTTDNGNAFTGVILDGSGHIRVTVSSDKVIVDYVRAWLPADETDEHKNGELAYSYTIFPKATAVESHKTIPDKFVLEQNYPNPFNPTTTISFSLEETGYTTLKVYDVLGNEVKTLVDNNLLQGKYSYELNANDMPAGVYFYQIRTNNNVLTKKALLLK